MSYNRCGISDIFLKLPPNATRTTDRICGTFEFFFPITDGTQVQLFIQKDGEWIHYDTQSTHKGQVWFYIPLEIQKKPGRYQIRMVPINYPSKMAVGSLFIAERNTKLVCFDIDGTLTVGNQELLLQLALDLLKVGYETRMRNQAVAMVRWWWTKGYIPIYLSGRQGSAYNFTRQWLLEMGLVKIFVSSQIDSVLISNFFFFESLLELLDIPQLIYLQS